MKIEIELLKKHLDLIPEFAKILHQGLGKWLGDVNSTEIESWLHEWLNENIPCAYVAFAADLPVGICSLQLNDGIRSDLKPWLGDLCVAENFQGLGVGTLLVNAVKNKARSLGYAKLYLFTPELKMHDYYAILGFNEIGTDEYNGHTVLIMEANL